MVALGRANSRMKDFYDVWALSKTYDFNHERLAQAIAATFEETANDDSRGAAGCLYA
jgi:Nucleotidyl transferase AbiEii toxin, Type IV TA system